MTVKFQDYYETLGVARSASADEIRKAYRKLARKAHPDVNKAPDAEEKFKQLTEAYEVLSDDEKRKRYDQLGANWQAGQDFQPPPGFGDIHFDFGGGPGGPDGFSDFFSMLFGRGSPFAGGAGPRRGRAPARRGQDQEVAIELTLEEIQRGGSKPVQLAIQSIDERGRATTQTKTFDVKLPVGLTDGSRIRLAGQGAPGAGGGPAGDLHLIVNIANHPQFAVQGHDLRTAVVVTPWEAALGAQVSIPTLSGTVDLKLPAGTQGGQVLRLRGQGLKRDADDSGALLVTVRIAVPEQLSDRERELFEQLARESEFRPQERTRRP